MNRNRSNTCPKSVDIFEKINDTSQHSIPELRGLSLQSNSSNTWSSGDFRRDSLNTRHSNAYSSASAYLQDYLTPNNDLPLYRHTWPFSNHGTSRHWKDLENIWKDSESDSPNSFTSSVTGTESRSFNSSLDLNDLQVPNLLTNASKNGYRPPRMRRRVPSCVECVFCKNNGATEDVYRSHILKDPEGNILCPTLRAYNCPVCNNGGGKKAHTIRYCPQNRPNGWRRSNSDPPLP